MTMEWPCVLLLSAAAAVAVAAAAAAAAAHSKHRDMDYMRQYVAESFDIMLRRTHVDAHIKTGILGCEVRSA
jgi:hypothetical protein